MTVVVMFEEIRSALWQSGKLTDADRAVLVEQYKIYVEMSDRISARRGTANTFFLTLNTGVATIVATNWKGVDAVGTGLAVFLLIIMIIQCVAWAGILRSYRQLNATKYAVVGALEEKLPASPYWRGEWQTLGQGRNPARYRPLTLIERWVPVLFALTYVGAFVALLIS